MRRVISTETRSARGFMDEMPELRLLFHRLNNQLGIILAHAELMHAKAPDDANRARRASRRKHARSDGHDSRAAQANQHADRAVTRAAKNGTDNKRLSGVCHSPTPTA